MVYQMSILNLLDLYHRRIQEASLLQIHEFSYDTVFDILLRSCHQIQILQLMFLHEKLICTCICDKSQHVLTTLPYRPCRRNAFIVHVVYSQLTLLCHHLAYEQSLAVGDMNRAIVLTFDF